MISIRSLALCVKDIVLTYETPQGWYISPVCRNKYELPEILNQNDLEQLDAVCKVLRITYCAGTTVEEMRTRYSFLESKKDKLTMD